ncbi:putative fibrous sheath CABYR-binding protein-like [Scophthalmus maximus]|uniref:Putative fibrous sheath CABYR-binding protein-like n=1 Tax=Scophthalmus maximus TaxID=52904 RepID=A0A2U9CBE3_SCOMX|nr:putative fibrous sheath CABYR-binding protein-like [Scophthalmus maximus]
MHVENYNETDDEFHLCSLLTVAYSFHEEPAADPEVAELPTAVAEDEPTAGPDATPAPVESGPDAEADPDVDDNQEEPTDPAAAKPEVSDNIVTGVRALVPTVEEDVADLNAAPVAGPQEDDKPQAQEASSSSLAGILCGIAVAGVAAVAGYFTYRKKKLCFQNRQEADPEAARKADPAEAESDPQVLGNLLNSP